MTPFIHYTYNALKKYSKYFNSQMYIARQIMEIIPEKLHLFIQDHGDMNIKTFVLFLYIFIYTKENHQSINL